MAENVEQKSKCCCAGKRCGHGKRIFGLVAVLLIAGAAVYFSGKAHAGDLGSMFVHSSMSAAH